jgi:hypothetical protein
MRSGMPFNPITGFRYDFLNLSNVKAGGVFVDRSARIMLETKLAKSKFGGPDFVGRMVEGFEKKVSDHLYFIPMLVLYFDLHSTIHLLIATRSSILMVINQSNPKNIDQANIRWNARF